MVRWGGDGGNGRRGDYKRWDGAGFWAYAGSWGWSEGGGSGWVGVNMGAAGS